MITNDSIHQVYKRTKAVYMIVMCRITDHRAQSAQRFKELCRLADKLHYAVYHLKRFI